MQSSLANKLEAKMSKGAGDWLIVMKLPDMRSRPIGRYQTRGEAEQVKAKIARLSGNRFPLQVLFDPQSADPQQHNF